MQFCFSSLTHSNRIRLDGVVYSVYYVLSLSSCCFFSVLVAHVFDYVYFSLSFNTISPHTMPHSNRNTYNLPSIQVGDMAGNVVCTKPPHSQCTSIRIQCFFFNVCVFQIYFRIVWYTETTETYRNIAYTVHRTQHSRH